MKRTQQELEKLIVEVAAKIKQIEDIAGMTGWRGGLEYGATTLAPYLTSMQVAIWADTFRDFEGLFDEYRTNIGWDQWTAFYRTLPRSEYAEMMP